MAAVWMDIFKDEIDEQRQEARQDTMVTAIRNLMQNTQWSAEKAMDALSIPQSQRATYVGLVKRV